MLIKAGDKDVVAQGFNQKKKEKLPGKKNSKKKHKKKTKKKKGKEKSLAWQKLGVNIGCREQNVVHQ